MSFLKKISVRSPEPKTLFSRRALSPKPTLQINILKEAEQRTKKPLLDPFGWQYPSLTTLFLMGIYGLNLFENTINFQDSFILKPLNISTEYENYMKECSPLHLYGLTANTLGLLALGIFYTLHANNTFYKEFGWMVLRPDSKNLLYLPMLVNIGIETSLRIKNGLIQFPKNTLNLNVIVAGINTSILIMSAILKSVNLSKKNMIYGTASHRVLKKLNILQISRSIGQSTSSLSTPEWEIKYNEWKEKYDDYTILHLLKEVLSRTSFSLPLTPPLSSAIHLTTVIRPAYQELYSSRKEGTTESSQIQPEP